MKHVQKISRGRFVLLCSALAMAGALAIVPWRVVAQDAKAPGAAAAAQNDSKAQAPAKTDGAPKPSTTAENKAATPADKSAAEKLIGAWRSGTGSGKLTFSADGTFSEFPNTLTLAFATAAGLEVFEIPTTLKGTWKIVDCVLELNWKCKVRDPALPGAPPPSESDFAVKEFATKARISRLDPTFLRLTMIDSKDEKSDYTMFFRRVEAFGLDTLKGKVSDTVLKVAGLAGMDSQEALALDKWTKSNPTFAEGMNLVERVAAAKNGKLTFVELVKLSPEEDKAYIDLKKLTDFVPQQISLADQNLLEDKEQSATRRIQAFAKEFNSFAYLLNSPNAPKYASGFSPNLGGGGGGGGGGGFIAPAARSFPAGNPAEKTPSESEAVQKLVAVLDELGDWLFSSDHAPLLGGSRILPDGAVQPGGLFGGGGF